MTSASTAGAVLGLLAGFGLVLLWRALPARRRPSLLERVGPYLGERPAGHLGLGESTGSRSHTPFPTLERLVAPFVVDAAGLLHRVLGGAVSVRRRLDRSGTTATVHEFRVEQVVWGACAGAVAVAVSLLMLAVGATHPPALLAVFCVASTVLGVVLRDRRLSAAVTAREERMMAEFPTVADLLALSVAAGEGPSGALERVARTSGGELAREIRRALGEAHTGTGLVDALDGIAERTGLSPLARFADGVAVALERGTPLAAVLHAQAVDVREARKRSLLEIGGRKEILMMVPVVFLVLPVTILFALYPGLIQITAVAP